MFGSVINKAVLYINDDQCIFHNQIISKSIPCYNSFMIDVHCHLNFKSFTDDYEQVIKDAYSAGVTEIINVGTQVSSSKWAVELAGKYNNLYAIVGVHPHHSDKVE